MGGQGPLSWPERKLREETGAKAPLARNHTLSSLCFRLRWPSLSIFCFLMLTPGSSPSPEGLSLPCWLMAQRRHTTWEHTFCRQPANAEPRLRHFLCQLPHSALLSAPGPGPGQPGTAPGPHSLPQLFTPANPKLAYPPSAVPSHGNSEGSCPVSPSLPLPPGDPGAPPRGPSPQGGARPLLLRPENVTNYLLDGCGLLICWLCHT